MSNNVVSHQFQFQDRQTVQMENVDSLTSDMQNQVVGHVSHNFSPFHMPISSDLGGTVEPLTTYSGFPSLMVPKNQVMHMETKPGTVGFVESGFMIPNIGQQSSLLPSKRKAEVEATGNNSISQQSSVANKRAVQLGTSSNLTPALQSNQLNRKSVHSQSKFGPAIAQNTPSLNKKFMRNESTSGKSSSQRVQTPKSRTVQVEAVSRARTESVGAVRSKMREKLAEALSLTSENQGKSSDAEKNITKTSTSGPGQGDSYPPVADTGAIGVHEDNCQAPEGATPVESCPAGKSDHSQGLSAQVSNDGSLNNDVETCTDSHHFTILPQHGGPYSDNFFVKDELLQGNGLSWALDFDMAVAEVREPSQVEAQQERLSPEKLASEIEVELFKLFGGVNKKYKEKGRSLCFNLKDPNNPELRERVMSGEISPERLCSMSAEELASKELSQWRMAKAEEFAQMVVLPDTDFDRRRRLVKKTHKGEYQVEIEEDSGDLMDVSSGTSLPVQNQTRGKETEASAASEVDDLKNKGKIDNRKSSSENNDHQGSLIIPSDGTDLMQGMIVDELKDAEFLPPIISLDEFMESLHSEPPFESLQAADARTVSEKEKEKSDVGNSSAAESEASKDASSERVDQAVKARKVDVASKSSESPMVQKKVPSSDHSPRIRHLWEGTIQLTVSSTISTFSVFKSGEKTTTVEWPSSLEIKGRVRLDAFEKFIKELPMSRSRAVMILHFALKDSESESDRANLLEAVDSYVSDKRLGFAEPATGVELYFCPANASMIDMLSSYLMKEREDIGNSSDNGLIGVVVWRKAPVVSTKTISPNSSSHNKHTSSMKRQQHHLTSSRKHQEKDANVNMNAMSKGPSVYQNAKPPAPTLPANGNNDDDESDIPPGFGPAGATTAKDDDDLPEFNFSGNINPAMSRPSSSISHIISRTAPFKGPPRPVEQMRQLVHKYGQTASASASADSSRSWLGNKGSSVGLGIKPWNDDDEDDDDDIPEWRPLAPHQHHHQHQPPPPNHHGLRQPVHDPYVNQHFVSTVATHHHPLNGSTSIWQQGGGRWVQPSQVNPGNQSSGGGQYYRIPMVQTGQRQDVSKSRGF